jgi:hypothetical protein
MDSLGNRLDRQVAGALDLSPVRWTFRQHSEQQRAIGWRPPFLLILGRPIDRRDAIVPQNSRAQLVCLNERAAATLNRG